MEGTMLWFNEVKDLGVITTADGERVPVHGSGFAGPKPQGRCMGMPITYRIAGENGTRIAVDVTLAPEIAPRRARMRHARYRSH
jgi:cold shock CspA family protein